MISIYSEFLKKKTQYSGASGFEPTFMPDCMFDFLALNPWYKESEQQGFFADQEAEEIVDAG